LPGGRNDLQPSLELRYSTGNGNGAFGLGWQVSLPGITCTTAHGIPRYDEDLDTYVLSGSEDLVPMDASATARRYRPRTERFVRQHRAPPRSRVRIGLLGGHRPRRAAEPVRQPTAGHPRPGPTSAASPPRSPPPSPANPTPSLHPRPHPPRGAPSLAQPNQQRRTQRLPPSSPAGWPTSRPAPTLVEDLTVRLATHRAPALADPVPTRSDPMFV
jgi:hypothetical protein